MIELASKFVARVTDAIQKRVAPISYARRIGVEVGSNCRLINVSFSTEPYLVTLGDHVSATAVRFETHDGGVWVFREEFGDIDVVRPITVGDNVFIGYGTVVLPGSVIGNNVVIGAGSVVAGEVPSHSVAVGTPARVIRPLSDYRTRVLERGAMTKRLSASQKRQFYTECAPGKTGLV